MCFLRLFVLNFRNLECPIFIHIHFFAMLAMKIMSPTFAAMYPEIFLHWRIFHAYRLCRSGWQIYANGSANKPCECDWSLGWENNPCQLEMVHIEAERLSFPTFGAPLFQETWSYRGTLVFRVFINRHAPDITPIKR